MENEYMYIHVHVPGLGTVIARTSWTTLPRGTLTTWVQRQELSRHLLRLHGVVCCCVGEGNNWNMHIVCVQYNFNLEMSGDSA